jgi:hypothetical protein
MTKTQVEVITSVQRRRRKRSETGALRRQGLSWIGMVLIGTVSAPCLDLGRALLTS